MGITYVQSITIDTMRIAVDALKELFEKSYKSIFIWLSVFLYYIITLFIRFAIAYQRKKRTN